MPSSVPIQSSVRSRLKACRKLVVCAAIVAVPVWAQVEVDPGVLDELASGRARAVVELRLPYGFRPEGTLSESAADAQRQAILVAQQSILAALDGTDALLLRQPHTIPFLTLEVGPDAIAKLRTMPELVSRILEDSSAVAN